MPRLAHRVHVEPHGLPEHHPQIQFGDHEHVVDKDNPNRLVGGEHRHLVLFQDRLMVTELDGAHEHNIHRPTQAVFEGGGHTHHLVLPGGQIIESSRSLDHRHPRGEHEHVFEVPNGHECTTLSSARVPARKSFSNEATPMTYPAHIFLDADDQDYLLTIVPQLGDVAGSSLDVGVSFAIGRDGLTPGDLVSASQAFSMHGSRYTKSLMAKDQSVRVVSAGKVSVGRHAMLLTDKASIELGAQGDHFDELFVQSPVFTGSVRWSTDGHEASFSNADIALGILKLARAPEAAPLPTTLKSQVPEGLRFWDETDALLRQSKFEALTRSGWLDPDNVQVVNGEIVRVEREVNYYVYKHQDEPEVPDVGIVLGEILPTQGAVVSPMAQGQSLEEIEKHDVDATLFYDLAPHKDDLCGVVNKLTAMPHAYLIAHVDTPEARATMAKAGALFKVQHPKLLDRVFVSSYPTPVSARVFTVQAPVTKTDEHEAKVQELLEGTRFIAPVEKNDGEERFVYGVVLEPDTIDAQQDTISADEVRKAAHLYMDSFRNIGLQHSSYVNNQVQILESYIAPESFKVNGVEVRKGSWILGVRVKDDGLWKAVKSGMLTGFSIGGSSSRTPIKS